MTLPLLPNLIDVLTSQTFYGNPTTFPNSDFQHAFSQAFFAMAVALNPNVVPVPPVITPSWPTWSESGLEMLFNQTAGGDPQPVVQTVKTDEQMLTRCRYVPSPVDSQTMTSTRVVFGMAFPTKLRSEAVVSQDAPRDGTPVNTSEALSRLASR